MSTKDISRFLFQPRKRYSSVRMQQGRVILDSDWNESERIDDEQARRTLVDLICTKGTSNQGFRIANVRDAEVDLPGANPVLSYDFDFENGSFYIGGLRFETETDEETETFLSQNDWLQIDASAGTLPERPQDLPAGGVRHDLVYLRGWEQCVTAVEDSELRERALGGPDTSVRIRRMRRVEVLTDVPDTCSAAVDALKERLTGPFAPDSGPSHEFDGQSCELKSKARLTVVPNPADITEDPCKPAVPGGYLGADNQTIRVQLTATNRFIWGYDNASPLYRVQVDDIPDVPEGVDGTRRRIRFLTLPPDQASQPLSGQAVEIIPWGALLPNQEKVAAFQGRIFTVETSFDPEGGSLTISQPVPEEWLQWLASHSPLWSDRNEPEHQQYFYLRLWTGGSGDADDPDHELTPGTSVVLQGTGLSVTFSDHGLQGDFWVIAARPNTPDLVVPWELLDSAPPAGPKYYFAPLALIGWSLDENNEVQADVHDCRERFRPLCDLRGCCSVTVGDGVSSHGDFASIEDAVAHLPADGGEVCLLPGLHLASVVISRRRNILVKGCGKQTRIIPRESSREAPIFRVVDSQSVTLRDIELVTLGGTAVVFEGSEIGALKEVGIYGSRIVACKQAILVRRGVDVQIRDNRIRMLDKEDSGFGVQMLAEDALVERNDIGVVPAEQTSPPDLPEDAPDPIDPCANPEIFFINPRLLRLFADHIFGIVLSFFPVAPFKALGGIQVAAGSERVRIVDNTIKGGAGDGITLGGGLPEPEPEPEEEPEEPQHTIESTGDGIQGYVLQNGSGLSGISLAFTRDDGVTRTAVSGSGGYFFVRTEPGQYTVFLSSTGFRIDNIATPAPDPEFGRIHEISVVREEPAEPADTGAFLHEIEIDDNEIAHMGLCGIGFPIIRTRVTGAAPTVATATVKKPGLAAVLALLGNPVVTLGIHRNYIHECLRNPFDGELRKEARSRGFGGISLGFCENLLMTGNRIERNGTSHVDPVCGVYVRFVEKLDIHQNHIVDNGPLTSNGEQGLERGIRGGMVLTASSSGTDRILVRRLAEFDTGRHAACLHDNIVYQPTGHALRLLALGTTSVCGNQFASEISGPEASERLAGVLFVLVAGGSRRFPAGLSLFSNNQFRLGAEATSLVSQLIWTTDDLGFDGNQSVALTDGVAITDTVSVFVNTFLLGQTLRATDSRFKEPRGRRGQAFKTSLLTRSSLLNNTNDNQGDHCIFAFNSDPSRPPEVAGNQIVDDTLCPPLNDRIAVAVSRFPVGVTIGD